MRWTALCIALFAAASCTAGSDSTTVDSASSTTPESTTASTTTLPGEPGDQPLEVDPTTHTVAELRSIADYEALARSGVGEQSVVKFSITEFTTDPEVAWLDSSFYELHDEWYWFQLLNGAPVRGFDTEPVTDLDGFDSIDDAYAWAEERRDTLPLDLRFTTSGRLYSAAFYEEVLDARDDRRVGVGSLIRSPSDAAPDRWLMELEFSDAVNVDQVERYLQTLSNSLPAEITDSLAWVPRSRAQELTADELTQGNSEFADRVVRYDELFNAGDIEVYSPGITAGRLLLVTDDGQWSLADAGPNDIVAIERAPDDLPPGNGLITGTPQTPLAHVNILAINRGVPNAFLAGLADDPTLGQLGRVRARVLVLATAEGELDIVPLTDDEYDGWLAIQGQSPISVPTVDVSDVANVVAIESVSQRPIIGGKAAGFVELAAPGTTTMPENARAITVRPYLEHMAQFDATVDALLADTDLDTVRGRYLFLEGRNDFDERYTADDDQAFADSFTDQHPVGTPIGDALAADGFVKQIRASTIDADTLADITAQIETAFGDLAPTQGLRFRSSSTVEDIEGFNGAGLYDSNTGYFDPTVLADEDDHHRTIERAILRTWSSYWGAIAFEERQRENIDHRSGAMAVLVHPRFDDELEVSNGVATFTLNPDADTAALMVINVQDGAVSVTNADDDAGLRPEVIEVRRGLDDATPTITRVAASTLRDEILDDATVLALFEESDAVAQSWSDRANALLPAPQRSATLTLDLEFRQMADGWPARADGTVEPARMVLKQARTLDPGLRGVPEELLILPIPRDVLAHTGSAELLTCTFDDIDAIGVRLEIDPFASIDPGFNGQPIERWVTGTDLAAFDPTVPAATSLADTAVGTVGSTEDCATSSLLADPSAYLLDLLAAR